MTQTLHAELPQSTLAGISRLAQLREQSQAACVVELTTHGLTLLGADLGAMHASTALSKLEVALDVGDGEACVSTYILLSSADALKLTKQADAMAITVDYLITLCIVRGLQEMLPPAVLQLDILKVQSVLDLLRQQPTMVIMDTGQTCWEGSLERPCSGPGEAREIIQIGAVTVETDTFAVVSEIEILVRPKLNPRLSPFCTALTGITQSRVETEGLVFTAAYSQWGAYAEDQLVLVYRAAEEVMRENLEAHDDVRNAGVYLKLRPLLEACGVDMEGVNSGTVGHSLGSQETFREHDALADVKSMAAGLNMLARLARPLVEPPPSVQALGDRASICSAYQTKQEGCSLCQTDLTDDPAFAELVADAQKAGLCTCSACGFDFYRTVPVCPKCNNPRP